jgi:glycine/D-amino acid oxidase-like deaminating enzyme
MEMPTMPSAVEATITTSDNTSDCTSDNASNSEPGQEPSAGDSILGQKAAGTSFQVIIAGAGVSGLLVAHRYCAANPEGRVLILEKDSRAGGRLGTLEGDWRGIGFNAVTPRLYEFWNQAIKHDPEADDLPTLLNEKQTRAAVLMGNKFSAFETKNFCSDKGARALGGLAAQRQWGEVTALFDAENRFDKSFAELWKSARKCPATLVLETYAQAFGITNIWESTPGAIAERGSFYVSEPFTGDWTPALKALTKHYEETGRIVIHTNARIINANHDEDVWQIQTAQGHFFGERLVVAQAPWIASQWLPKNLWPTQLLAVINKTKPVSLVTLSCPILEGDTSDLAQFVVIPSESIQASVSPKEIVFQATIDYELSLQAPDVVKAVKRLKRAHRKFLLAAPQIKTGIERLSLVPVAWAQSPIMQERKHLDRLKMENIQDGHLAFCGDAYGQSLNGDDNLIESVISASEAINQ